MIYNQRDGIKTQKCSRKKLHFGEMTAQADIQDYNPENFWSAHSKCLMIF